MANYSTNEFKGGLKIMLDGEPCNILENEYVKPGKGQAFNRVKIRKLISGKVLEKTFRSGESVEGADVMDTELAYLYTDGEFYHFMNNDTFEQIAADEKAVGENKKRLVENDVCTITLWNGSPITVTGLVISMLSATSLTTARSTMRFPWPQALLRAAVSTVSII